MFQKQTSLSLSMRSPKYENMSLLSAISKQDILKFDSERLRQYYYHHVDFKLFDLDETQKNRLFLLKHAFGILRHLDHNETTECWPNVWQNVTKCFISSYVLQ